MDAFQLLKTDHQKVSGIFDQIEASEPAARQQLFTQLKHELDVHAHIEETVLYPVLKQAAETRDITLEAIEEHQEVKDLLAELQGMSTDDEDWEDTISELRENVEHHVHEEEGEMFEKARTVLSQQQIEDLGDRLAAAKNQQAASAS